MPINGQGSLPAWAVAVTSPSDPSVDVYLQRTLEALRLQGMGGTPSPVIPIATMPGAPVPVVAQSTGVNGHAILPPIVGALSDALIPGSGVITAPLTDLLLTSGDEDYGTPPGFVGPGVPEPPASLVKKRWETRVYDNELGYVKMNFYSLVDGRIAMYHNYKKYWKIWRPKKNIVLSSNPRLKDLKKLDRVYTRMQKMVKKFAPKTRVTSVQAPSRYLSAAERKLLKAGG